MRYRPVHHTIVATDVVASGGRDDQLQLRMRRDLREIVSEVLAAQSVDLDNLVLGDLGDGLRLQATPDVPPNTLLDPFIPNLATALREHRKAASAGARLRLRVAVHTGLLHPDPGGGWAGQPLIHCARLLDSEPLRRALADTPGANLALIVSQAVYDGVVRHGYGLDPDTYRPVTVAEKELRAAAWIHVPGGERSGGGPGAADPVGTAPAGPAPAGPPDPAQRADRPAPAAGPQTSTVSVVGDKHVFHGPIVGGNSYRSG